MFFPQEKDREACLSRGVRKSRTKSGSLRAETHLRSRSTETGTIVDAEGNTEGGINLKRSLAPRSAVPTSVVSEIAGPGCHEAACRGRRATKPVQRFEKVSGVGIVVKDRQLFVGYRQSNETKNRPQV